MAVTVDDVAKLVGASAPKDGMVDCLAQGTTMVETYIADNALPGKTVPSEIRDRAVLEVAADLWHRRQARFGIVNESYASGDGITSEPIRISRDPLAVARPILAQWVMELGIA